MYLYNEVVFIFLGSSSNRAVLVYVIVAGLGERSPSKRVLDRTKDGGIFVCSLSAHTK
jgi:hypothetical protein